LAELSVENALKLFLALQLFSRHGG